MKVTIIGSGIFGISIANMLVSNNHKVTIWTSKENIKSRIVPKGTSITNDLKVALDNTDVIIILVKSNYFEEVINRIKPYYNNQLILIGSKGLCDNKLLYDIATSSFDKSNIGLLYGPTFAVDVKNLEPVGFTYAGADNSKLDLVKNLFNKSKIEYTNLVREISLLSVLKNAYSIGSGILDGMEYGSSTKGLYLCEVLNEINYLFDKEKLNKDAINTYAGIGDLFLTASSNNSRNYTYGIFMGLGDFKAADNFKLKNTVEGLDTLDYFSKSKLKILNTIYNIINNNAKKEDLINLLQ